VVPAHDNPDIERLKDELRHIREVVRPKRIEQIIRDDCGGSRKTFAERIGKNENYISRMRRDSAGNKSIGEETAYIIEHRFHKPRGWLDDDVYEGLRDTPPVSPLLSDEAAALAIAWQSLIEPVRTQLRILITTLAAPATKKPRGASGRNPSTDAPAPTKRAASR
jgi:hypothetical protein